MEPDPISNELSRVKHLSGEYAAFMAASTSSNLVIHSGTLTTTSPKAQEGTAWYNIELREMIHDDSDPPYAVPSTPMATLSRTSTPRQHTSSQAEKLAVHFFGSATPSHSDRSILTPKLESISRSSPLEGIRKHLGKEGLIKDLKRMGQGFKHSIAVSQEIPDIKSPITVGAIVKKPNLSKELPPLPTERDSVRKSDLEIEDLKRFSENFKLTTPVPEDIMSIIRTDRKSNMEQKRNDAEKLERGTAPNTRPTPTPRSQLPVRLDSLPRLVRETPYSAPPKSSGTGNKYDTPSTPAGSAISTETEPTPTRQARHVLRKRESAKFKVVRAKIVDVKRRIVFNDTILEKFERETESQQEIEVCYRKNMTALGNAFDRLERVHLHSGEGESWKTLQREVQDTRAARIVSDAAKIAHDEYGPTGEARYDDGDSHTAGENISGRGSVALLRVVHAVEEVYVDDEDEDMHGVSEEEDEQIAIKKDGTENRSTADYSDDWENA